MPAEMAPGAQEVKNKAACWLHWAELSSKASCTSWGCPHQPSTSSGASESVTGKLFKLQACLASKPPPCCLEPLTAVMQPPGGPSGGQGTIFGPARSQAPYPWSSHGLSSPMVVLPFYQLVPNDMQQPHRQPAQQLCQPGNPQPPPLLPPAHFAAVPAWRPPPLQQHWRPPSFVGLRTPPALQQPWRPPSPLASQRASEPPLAAQQHQRHQQLQQQHQSMQWQQQWRPPAHADGPRMAPHPRPPLVCGPLPRPWQPSPSPWLPPKQAGFASSASATDGAAGSASRADMVRRLPTDNPGPRAAASSGQLGPPPPTLPGTKQMLVACLPAPSASACALGGPEAGAGGAAQAEAQGAKTTAASAGQPPPVPGKAAAAAPRRAAPGAAAPTIGASAAGGAALPQAAAATWVSGAAKPAAAPAPEPGAAAGAAMCMESSGGACAALPAAGKGAAPAARTQAGAPEVATASGKQAAAVATAALPQAAGGQQFMFFERARPEDASATGPLLPAEHAPGGSGPLVAQRVGSKRSMLSSQSEDTQPAGQSQEGQAVKRQCTSGLPHSKQPPAQQAQQQEQMFSEEPTLPMAQTGRPAGPGPVERARATAAGGAGAEVQAAASAAAAAAVGAPGAGALGEERDAFDRRLPGGPLLSSAAPQEPVLVQDGAGQQAGREQPSSPSLKFKVVVRKHWPSLQADPAADAGGTLLCSPAAGAAASCGPVAAARQSQRAHPGEGPPAAPFLQPQLSLPQQQRDSLMPPPPPRPHKALRKPGAQPGQVQLAASSSELAGTLHAAFPEQQRGQHPFQGPLAGLLGILRAPSGPAGAVSMHEAAVPTGEVTSGAVAAAPAAVSTPASIFAAAATASAAAEGLPSAARYLAAYLGLLREGQERRCALQLLHRLGSRRPPRMSLLAAAGWAEQQGFALEEAREALRVLQEAAVVELVQPANCLANPAGPEQAILQLLPGGAGLQLTEADVAAAAGEAAAQVASGCNAAEAAAAQMAVDAVAGGGAPGLPDEETSEALLLQEGSEADPEATAEPCTAGCDLSPALHSASLPCGSPAAAAGMAGMVAAKQPPLTLPLNLAIKWQRAQFQPSQAALCMLRPGAAAMLHAVLEAPTRSLPTTDLDGIALDFLESLAEVTAEALPPTSIALWCRQLLQSCGLLSCRVPNRGSRQWFVPAGQTEEAAAAAAEVLGGLGASVSLLMQSEDEPQEDGS